MNAHISDFDPELQTAIAAEIGEPHSWTTQKLTSIVFLHVRHARSLDGLAFCPGVKILVLTGCDPVSMSSLVHLDRLASLTIAHCNISSISGIEELKLTAFRLTCGFVEDVSPLTGLANLLNVQITGNPLTEASYRRVLPSLQERGVLIDSPKDREWHLTRRLREAGLPYVYYESARGGRLARPGLEMTERPEADHPAVDPLHLEQLLSTTPSRITEFFN
ncbi:hypothetical protein AB0F42_25855 [Streptomyces buecherae]|uniref:hypothetical protein n=1 Tax=Streptomyces buecherae TaxID=2763006 RepID=UPI0033EEEB92